MGRSRRLIPAALVAVLSVVCLDAADAQSDICTRLEARLMALESRGGDPNQELSKAIDRQREELRRFEAEARRAGCMGSFLKRLNAKGACGSLMASVNRARSKLNRLKAARNGSAEGRSGSTEQQQLVRALAANDCGPHYQDYDRPARRGGLFASLFGGRPLFRDRGDSLFGRDGTFRTLCVRTCDGYYFPISFTTVQSRFARDEQVCRSMCPGTEVKLYVHRNPGEESDSMISLQGEPYVAMPTAFRYRQEFDSSCRCGQIKVAASSLPTSALSNELIGYGPARDDPWGFVRDIEDQGIRDGDAPVPFPRLAASEDPETLANRSGRLTPKIVDPPLPVASSISADGTKTVRIVGPAFYYSQ